MCNKYNICALVTVYYPDNTVVENMKLVEKQVTSIIIADNTPKKDNSYLFKNIRKIFYYSNKINMGLSMAFNNSLKRDKVINSDYILFLDQDTVIPEKLAETLINDYNKIRQSDVKVGCLGPVYYESNSMEIKKLINEKNKIMDNIYTIQCIMTSSMLTTYDNLKKIGFWNENIFLDFADWDLCWRWKNVDLLCCVTKNAIINHRVGEAVKKKGPFSLKVGPPIREYYQTRDCLKLLLKKYTPIRYKFKFILIITIRPIVHIIFLTQKYLRAKYIVCGIVDFFRSINYSFDLRKTNV